MKILLFLFLIFLNNNIFCKRFYTEPVLVEPQCDRFNDPICITYPAEGQVFVTDSCVSGCALCICNNGFSCSQRVLSRLTVRGTTRKPFQTVTVTLMNTKMASGISTNIDSTFELVTTSKPAPDGTGVWSVTFTGGIVTPRPAPFNLKGIPTTISVSVSSDWNSNYATRSIFIKKDKVCNLDCDLACRRSHILLKCCHIYDSLTKAIKNKYQCS